MLLKIKWRLALFSAPLLYVCAMANMGGLGVFAFMPVFVAGGVILYGLFISNDFNRYFWERDIGLRYVKIFRSLRRVQQIVVVTLLFYYVWMIVGLAPALLIMLLFFQGNNSLVPVVFVFGMIIVPFCCAALIIKVAGNIWGRKIQQLGEVSKDSRIVLSALAGELSQPWRSDFRVKIYQQIENLELEESIIIERLKKLLESGRFLFDEDELVELIDKLDMRRREKLFAIGSSPAQ